MGKPAEASARSHSINETETVSHTGTSLSGSTSTCKWCNCLYIDAAQQTISKLNVSRSETLLTLTGDTGCSRLHRLQTWALVSLMLCAVSVAIWRHVLGVCKAVSCLGDPSAGQLSLTAGRPCACKGDRLQAMYTCPFTLSTHMRDAACLCSTICTMTP